MSKYVGKIVTNQAPAGYSVYFDGTGDYLSVASNAAFGFGTGDFTVEFWVNLPSASTTQVLFDNRIVTGLGLVIYSNTGTLTVNFNNTGGVLITGGALTSNTWTHIALTRASGSSRLFINGTQSGSTAADSNNYPTNATYIGGNFSAGQLTTGYISNFRIVKGTALYTAAFTPPTQLLNITNTSLLTCNSPAIIDQSSNAFAITTNGNAAVSTFTPFTAYVPYNPALGASTPGVWTLDEAMQAAATRQWNMYDPYFQNTTLLLHGNGTNAAQNNTFLDSSSNNFTITRNGNTTQGSFSPFSQTGWGNYFAGGANQWIQAPYNTAFDFGTGDFSVECFAYVTDAGRSYDANKYGVFVSGGASLSITNLWGLGFGISGGVINQLFVDNAGANILTVSSQSISLNAWHHFVFCRTGSTLSVFVDGTRVGTISYSSAINTNSSGRVLISQSAYQDVYQNWLIGYMSNVRIIKGTQPYNAASSTITPPTSPLTNITNTSLLTCQSNRFVDNGTANGGNPFTITVVGTPSVQAFSPFYPTAAYTPQTIGGSGYFDGTGDSLALASNTALNPGSGDFTIEAWVYPTNSSNTAEQTIIAYGTGSGNLRFQVNNIRDLRVLDGASVIATGSSSINLSSWNHVVVLRSGSSSNNVRLYVNGSQVAQGTSTTNFTGTANIGDEGGRTFFGYMTGLRFVKNQALASGAFTPPTSPVTTTSVGWTGANAASSITGAVNLLLGYTNAGITDATAKNVLETVGNAQISTTQSKFGGSSMSFDGSGDYIVEPTNVNFGYGTGDFTIEFWLRLNSTATQTVVSNLTSASSVNPHLYILSGGSIRYYTANADRITGSTLSANQWYHVALCRSGTSTRLFIDGTQSGSTYTDSNNYGTTAPLGIGTYWASGTPVTADTLNGYIDDLRITKGVARYTANFTPQTSQWQDQ